MTLAILIVTNFVNPNLRIWLFIYIWKVANRHEWLTRYYSVVAADFDQSNIVVSLPATHRFNISVSMIEPPSIKTKIQEKVTGDKAAYTRLDKDQFDLYSDMFLEFDRAAEEHDRLAEDIEVTTPAFLHAITNPFPNTRYTLGSHGGMPLSWSRLLMPFIPDRLQDSIKMKNVRV